AQVSIREHESALNAQIVRVKNEVRKAFQTYQNNRKIMERFFKILEDSRGLLKNISNSYLKGNTAVFDFLEAQRSYLNTQELYYEALLNYRRSYLELIYVTSLINNVQ
nr:TolC family protein [Cytophagaceae bacterium]